MLHTFIIYRGLPESSVISYQNYQTQMLPEPCGDLAIYTTAKPLGPRFTYLNTKMFLKRMDQ